MKEPEINEHRPLELESRKTDLGALSLISDFLEASIKRESRWLPTLFKKSPGKLDMFYLAKNTNILIKDTVRIKEQEELRNDSKDHLIDHQSLM